MAAASVGRPSEVARVTQCRLCAARVSAADCVELVVPRGVHFFLRAEELAMDHPVRLQILACTYCGHLQSLDEPIIYAEHASSATYVSGPLLAARQEQARRTFGYAAQRPRRLLEIGCGDGQFLAELATVADVAVGIEPSPKNAALARARGIVVEQLLLSEETLIAGGPFDAFFAFHVLEHVPDVKAFLRGIRNNLAAGAVGCIEVPASEAAYEHARYGHFMADHLSYFFAPTLRLALESSGFDVLALTREWSGEHLAAYVRVRSAGAHAPIPHWVQSTTARLAAFLEGAASARERVAFWGASNPILPVLMELPQGLPYIVVDTAPTKHGLYAPGSHVLIQPIDALRSERVTYVVITAPRFVDEIQAQLSAAFDVRVETFVADVGVTDVVCRLHWPAADVASTAMKTIGTAKK